VPNTGSALVQLPDATPAEGAFIGVAGVSPIAYDENLMTMNPKTLTFSVPRSVFTKVFPEGKILSFSGASSPYIVVTSSVDLVSATMAIYDLDKMVVVATVNGRYQQPDKYNKAGWKFNSSSLSAYMAKQSPGKKKMLFVLTGYGKSEANGAPTLLIGQTLFDGEWNIARSVR